MRADKVRDKRTVVKHALANPIGMRSRLNLFKAVADHQISIPHAIQNTKHWAFNLVSEF
jgi:hypothetical protein